MAITVTEVIVTIAAFCAFIALLLYHLGRLRLYIEAAKFPGPRAFPIIGNVNYFRGSSTDILDSVMEMVHFYGSPARFWLGHGLYIAISEPEHAKIILESSCAIEKGEVYRFFRPWLGTGLFTAEETKWRRHRKPIAATFNSKILESFVEVFSRQSDVMTKQMRKELGAGEFEMYHYLSLCFLDIVCETAMGVAMKVQETNSRYANAVNGVLEAINKRIYHIWLYPDCIFNLTKMGRLQREHLKYVHSVTDNVIKMKKSSYNNETRVENGSAHERPGKRKAFLDLLIELSNAGTKFTEEELREEVDTMTFGGSHTGAVTCIFIMIMLANNPDIQERVYSELCDIYGDQVSSDTPVKNEDLNRMEYLERVIKETMRIFPIGPLIARKLNGDVNIGEYTLPNGASVAIILLELHRSEKTWPDPLKFDPDRFLPNEVAKRHPYCYMPFSGGPRNCIGLKYAMMVMKVLLATVLRRYVLKRNQVLEVKDIKLQADMLKPTKAMTLSISERVERQSVKK